MNIYIDEAGSFVQALSDGSWNTVCAVCVPEPSRKGLEDAVRRLKQTAKSIPNTEVKLRDIDEETYCQFLNDIANLKVLTFIVATDASKDVNQRIEAHQADQAQKIRSRIPTMQHAKGKASLEEIATTIEGLSPQLYVQMVCQFELVEEVLRRSILFLQSRYPASLNKFRWRIDQKNSNKTEFERTFEMLVPMMLQSKTIAEPLLQLDWVGADALARFEFGTTGVPDWMEEQYGIEIKDALDVGKIMREDMQFVDSKSSNGVQAADLLASGSRRLLRGGFTDNVRVARLMARSILTPLETNRLPINIVTLADSTSFAGAAATAISAMNGNTRPAI